LLIRLFVLLLVSFLRFLYILYINSLSVEELVKIFFPFCGLSINSESYIFWCAETF
jgi:hypothetical protein